MRRHAACPVDDRHSRSLRTASLNLAAAHWRRRRASRFPLPTAELERVAAAMLAAAQRGRRHGGRNRGLAGRRAKRHRAQRRSRDDRLQPRQGHRRHRVRRPAARPCEHRRFRAGCDRAPPSTRRSRSRATPREDPARGTRRSRRGSRARLPDLDLYHPWDLPVERRDRARPRGRGGGARRRPRGSPTPKARPSRAANRSSSTRTRTGFCGGYRSSRHHIDCSVIGEPATARCSATTGTRRRARRADLDAGGDVGRIAGERTARRLGARQLRHARMPGAVRGARSRGPDRLLRRRGLRRRLYRKSSFLLDSLGTQVFAPHVSHPRGAAPAARPRQRAVRQRRRRDGAARRRARRRRAGLLPRQLLGAQARHGDDRQRGRQPQSRRRATATTTSPALLRRMGRGLLVTEQLGQGVNPVTGDFSRGAAGFWIEDGEIAYPGRGDHDRRQPEATCSATSSPSAADVDRRGSRHTGSILVGRMTVAGALTARAAHRGAPMLGARLQLGPVAQRPAPQRQHGGALDRAAARDRRRCRSRRRRSSSSPNFPARAATSGPGRSRRCCASMRASSPSSRSSRSSTRRTTRRARASSRGCGTRCSTS